MRVSSFSYNSSLKKHRLFPFLLAASLRATAAFTASFPSTRRQSMSILQATANNDNKPRILCLHGRYQNGATFRNKIAGARRKLARAYDLEFLDGPIRLNADATEEPPAFAWWNKDDQGVHSLVEEGLDHVLQHMDQQSVPYQGVIGFSQGGVVATALCCSGQVPSLKAVVTAGSPMVEEAFVVADSLKGTNSDGYGIPKLHMAGETDAMISVESTTGLCERGGNGRLIVHDQGHLFPTRSARVQEVLDFLEEHLYEEEEEEAIEEAAKN